MARLSGPQPVVQMPGENDDRYLPLGVGIVIPPWNFPLAILVGMTVAALVTVTRRGDLPARSRHGRQRGGRLCR
jgi:hypothetical protein